MRHYGKRTPHFEQLEVRYLLTANAQIFDFGDAPANEGHVRTQMDAFDAERGFGWLSAPMSHTTPQSIRSAAGSSTFRVAVPAGDYELSVTMGDDLGTYERMQVFVASELAGEITTSADDPLVTLTRTVKVEAEKEFLDIAFDDGGQYPLWSLAQIKLQHVDTPDPTDPDPTDPNPTDPNPPHNEHVHDHVPNFGAESTIAATASGAWSDPSIWNAGHVPGAADVVVVPAGMTVELNSTDAIADVVSIDGILRFATDVDTQLKVSTLHVRSEGALEVGAASHPVTASAKIIIRDTPLDFGLDPEQFGTGLLVEGKVSIHGQAKTAFERLSAEALAGASEIHLAAPVTGWEVGDRLYIPDSNSDLAHFEHVVIAAIDGQTVTLASPLQFAHTGGRDGAGVLQFFPHVANLTRSVKIESENPNGTRGHTLYQERANIDIEYAEFNDLGRTTSQPLDSTTIEADGTVSHLGTNQIGRYSVHIHHLDGPAAPQENGHQFTVTGIVSNGGESQHKFKWGMAVHDSHYGLVNENVFVNWAGAGFLFEQGNETENVIDHNFSARVWGQAHREDSDSIEVVGGYGFWLAGVNNRITNNVAADVPNFGYLLGNFVPNTTMPVAQGSSVSKPVQPRLQPVLEFDDNEAYNVGTGLTIWYVSADTESVVSDFTAWHHRTGIYLYPTRNMRITGATLLGDYETQAAGPASGTGVSGGDYSQENFILENSTIQNNNIGVYPSTHTSGTTSILRNLYLRNVANIVIDTAITSGVPLWLQPRWYVIDNVTFVSPDMPLRGRVWTDIYMLFRNGASGDAINLIQKCETIVTNSTFNGVESDDFEAYFEGQAADYVVPQSTLYLVASPVAGLTNQENWDRFRIALAGAVAPADAKLRTGIKGLVSPPQPNPTDPNPTDPNPTDPNPTDPNPTDPNPTDPNPTDPNPTDPNPTDPNPTDPNPPHNEHVHDHVPNFGAESTIAATASGAWSDPSIWNAGHVPGAADVVVVPAGMTVELNSTDAIADVVSIDGILRFATDVDTQLKVSTLHVRSEGALEVGAASHPVTASAKIIIRDTPLDFGLDPEQFGTGLLVEGKVSIHGQAKTAFERLSAEALAGASEIHLAAPVTGWEVGDRLYIPDSNSDLAHFEHVVIAAIDGQTVTLASPLQFAHTGGRDGAGVLQFFPHVANLTRSVKIESENPNGTRGHTLYQERANIDIEYAEFNDLGRTTSQPLDSTTIEADGTVSHLGTNQIGRYSIHVHHLDGPAEPQENGHQFTIVGAVSNGGTEMHNFKWGMAVHDSHYGLVSENVFVNWAGAGFLFEQGNETENVIDHNFSARVWGPTPREDSDAAAVVGGYGFWLAGVNNRITNNVAANLGELDFGYVLGNFKANETIPVGQGSSTSKPVQTQLQPILEFDGNEAYNVGTGLSIWYVTPETETIVSDFTAWHHSRTGIYLYPTRNLRITGATLLGDYETQAAGPASGTGVSGGDYSQENFILENSTIQNNNIGVYPSTHTSGTTSILRNLYLRNVANIVIDTAITSGVPLWLQPRWYVIDNVTFVSPDMPLRGRVWTDIYMLFRNGASGDAINLIQKCETIVTNSTFNGVESDDFEAYFEGQAADYVVPQSTLYLVASPVAGLTNQENYKLFGIALAGKISPANATTRTGIHGLVSELGG